LSDYFNVDVVNNENHPLTESGTYVIPSDTDQAGYVEFAESLPIDDDCEIFGMHSNAAITSDINATNALLSVALSLQPRSVAAGAKTKDEVLNDLAKSILDQLPQAFDNEDAAKKHPIKYEESMNTVLSQELLRYNNLIRAIRSSLLNI